jgi:hypothetical protein
MALTIDLLRPDDLVTLQIEVRNLRLDTSDPKNPKLVVEKRSEPAYLIVGIQPQTITEKAYFETAANVTQNPPFNPNPPPLPAGSDNLDPAGSVPSRIGARSRLVFKLPSNITEIPYQTASLLDWSKFELMVSRLAQGKTLPPPITPPAPLDTAIEIPYRLILSPGSGAGWVNAGRPVMHAGRTELWHTRLARVRTVTTKTGSQRVLQEASTSAKVPLRAIWSPDFVDHGSLTAVPPPFQSSMDPSDRAQIVILTSGTVGYFVPGGSTLYDPQPIQASRLFLSALGGYLTSRGTWPAPPYYYPTGGGTAIQLDLTEWDHIATQGRDHYVRIVYDGFLYPFGHRATLVKVTERKVVPPGGGITTATAYMMQHMYIVVREHEKVYDPALYAHNAREMPLWQNVTMKTVVTPDIAKPQPLPGAGPGFPTSFWVQVPGTSGIGNFQFHLTATDLAGKTINILAPMIFMSVSEPSTTNVQAAYAGAGQARASSALGQKIAYADPAAGDTILKTVQLFFNTELLATGPPYALGPFAPFIPTLDEAAVSVPALEQLFGTGQVNIKLYDGYLKGGLDPNAGVYAQLSSKPPGLPFSADKAGGFATPSLTVKALSAREGAIGGKPTDAAAGQLDPQAFFDKASAKLFGTVPIGSLIPVDKFTKLAPSGPNATVIRTEFQPNHKNPTSMVTKVHWAPQLKDYQDSSGVVQILFNQQSKASALTLDATFTRNLKGGASSSNIKGALTNFEISLAGVIALQIQAITFTSKNGEKTIVTAQLPSSHPITFIGPLAFIQTLADILPPGLFGGVGPSINLSSTMIKVSYTIGLPPITAGMFSLQNIAITAGLDLPFLDGNPAFEFAFASRSKPFLVTVEIFGGGGFVHLVLDTQGIQMVEGAIEFGGNFAFDVGVASGGVHAMAGIYFQLKGHDSDLTGFIDIGGEVSVLGIISISIDLNLSLSWVHNPPQPDMVQGRATLNISVHILFFSLSVGVSVERSFSVGGGDPNVKQLVSPKEWAQYTEAFDYKR